MYSIELGKDTFCRSLFELKSIAVMVIIRINLPNLYSITLGENCFYKSSFEIKDLLNLYSIELGGYTFTLSLSIVISNLPHLNVLNLGKYAL